MTHPAETAGMRFEGRMKSRIRCLLRASCAADWRICRFGEFRRAVPAESAGVAPAEGLFPNSFESWRFRGQNLFAADLASWDDALVFIFSGKLPILRNQNGFRSLEFVRFSSVPSGLRCSPAGGERVSSDRRSYRSVSVIEQKCCCACSVLPCPGLDFSGLTQC
jgi:hypothetical protein